jgi:predicted DCC family thiol-disulfide oxidoreductase YuxK
MVPGLSEERMTDHSLDPCSRVYFDGACPMCQREIAFYKSKTEGQAVTFIDVTACDAADLGDGLTRDAALARLHVRRPDGTLVSGAAAFADLWKAVPGFRVLGRLAAWPPVTAVLEVGYRASLVIRPRLQPLFRRRQ